MCKYSPTITDITLKDLICKDLGLAEFDEKAVQSIVAQILITDNARIDIMRSFGINLQLQAVLL